MADYIRARSAAQKQERLDAIMKATDKLFQKKPYNEITMGAIAQSLGWSRSNLYKYASTHEEILLMIHDAKMQSWVNQLIDELTDTKTVSDDFAQSWARITEKHAGFLRYQTMCATVLEPNVSLDLLVQSKTQRTEYTNKLVAFLAEKCYIDVNRAKRLALQLMCEAPLLYCQLNPSSAATKALKKAGIAKPETSFVNEYADFVSLCIDDAYRGPNV
ncbi:MAG: TetR family transcriptional regulator [Atopobiaceae bacterium]|nr:TetR family transcriptional regulator [Atopobiaceae bacterium]